MYRYSICCVNIAMYYCNTTGLVMQRRISSCHTATLPFCPPSNAALPSQRVHFRATPRRPLHRLSSARFCLCFRIKEEKDLQPFNILWSFCTLGPHPHTSWRSETHSTDVETPAPASTSSSAGRHYTPPLPLTCGAHGQRPRCAPVPSQELPSACTVQCGAVLVSVQCGTVLV